MYPRTIRDFVGFVDGVGYAGKILEAKLPELKLLIANHRAGGMDAPAPQDMGMEAMQAEITSAEWTEELITLIGTRKRLVLRPAAKGQQDFSADGFIATLGGLWSSTKFADLKPGSDVPVTLMLEADYFRLEKNGEVLIEIDVEAYKRVINGVDQLTEIRQAMGF